MDISGATTAVANFSILNRLLYVPFILLKSNFQGVYNNNAEQYIYLE